MTKQQVDEALVANHRKLVALRGRRENIPATPAWSAALEERRQLRARAEAFAAASEAAS